jgi:hypothetical protein
MGVPPVSERLQGQSNDTSGLSVPESHRYFASMSFSSVRKMKEAVEILTLIYGT